MKNTSSRAGFASIRPRPHIVKKTFSKAGFSSIRSRSHLVKNKSPRAGFTSIRHRLHLVMNAPPRAGISFIRPHPRSCPRLRPRFRPFPALVNAPSRAGFVFRPVPPEVNSSDLVGTGLAKSRRRTKTCYYTPLSSWASTFHGPLYCVAKCSL